jgi:hypothetical protein
LQKYQSNKKNLRILLLSLTVIFISLPQLFSQITRKSKVEFYSSDSVLITADKYVSKKDNPYIILFHTEQSSRGEFDDLADRFIKMQYNCLSVDLRTGDEKGFVKNETAERVREQGLSDRLLTGRKDMIASLDYIYDLSRKPVLLLGSSSSASLALKIAKDDSRVLAVLALSPGEFFTPEFLLENIIQNLEKPVFLTGNANERDFLEKITSLEDNQNLNFFSPPEQSLGRGTSLLLNENPARDEYWMAVLIFIKSLKEFDDGEVSDNPL